MLKLTKIALATALLSTTTLSNAENFSFKTQVDTQSDTLVVFHGKNTVGDTFSHYDKKTEGQLSKAIKAEKFEGGTGKFVTILAPHNLDYERVLIVGVDDNALSKNKLSKLGGDLSAQLEQDNIETITIAADGLGQNNAQATALLAHGINLRAYRFDKYQKEKRQSKNYFFDVDNGQQSQDAYTPLSYIESGVFLARDLTSETATEMTPIEFADAAKSLKKLGVKVKVLTPKDLKKLNMGALEGVGRGSTSGSRLVVAHYEGSKDAPIALAGKGITFDSGGYNIKTHSSIAHMKVDMAGAAAALGTVKALALSKAKVNVVAVMGMAANMISENSVAPGDVLTTAEGLTIEITNTDAEGRLVLSDTMWYARTKYKPSILVDLATLTGSKVGAVGNEYAALFSEDDQLVEELTFAGKQVNENLWRLPLGYKDKLKSNIADLRNTGTGGPGATTAATFLQHFAGDVRWAHLDIAGNALASSSKGEVPKGGTGYGVRLLTEWILHKAN
ncbi:leucyl aminopeptidase [Thalassotalea profundi]|uniref:Probable cytosol aminopeptidase n=1 Tax=Thalassotalea profundi TaxID=2036687 RepID=A0ABQ3IWD9_9GAMM|nr:leucyl aminopeptidase [Thalassotalea profundi]GHE93954.1 putative cytosol aminopeptidase 1 [Thalassotalea profundi]